MLGFTIQEEKRLGFTIQEEKRKKGTPYFSLSSFERSAKQLKYKCVAIGSDSALVPEAFDVLYGALVGLIGTCRQATPKKANHAYSNA